MFVIHKLLENENRTELKVEDRKRQGVKGVGGEGEKVEGGNGKERGGNHFPVKSKILGVVTSMEYTVPYSGS